MADTGLVHKWQRDILTTFRLSQRNFEKETDKGKIILRPLNLSDLEGTFIIFIFGHLFSLFVLVLESLSIIKNYMKKAKEDLFWLLSKLRKNISENLQSRRRFWKKKNKIRKRTENFERTTAKQHEFFEEKLHEDLKALKKILQKHEPENARGQRLTKDQERALLLSRQATNVSLITPEDTSVEVEMIACSDVVEIE